MHSTRTYMNKHITLFLAMLVIVTGFTGCFKDSEEEEYSGMSLLTGASLGNLRRTIYFKTAEGKDTCQVITISGSEYPLTIDQINHHIYNAEMLPAHTSLSKVVLTSLNCQGTAAIKSLVDGKDTVFNYTDSTDFRVPRDITIYGHDGVSKTTYTMELRVREEVADSMRWEHFDGGAMLAMLQAPRLLTRGDSLIAWGTTNEGTTRCFWANRNAHITPEAWHELTLGNAPTPSSIVKKSGGFAALNATSIVTSENGHNWTPISPNNQGLLSLAAASSRSIYGINTQGFMRSVDGGQLWNTDEADNNDSIPTSHLTGVCYPNRTNPSIDELIVVGNTASGRTVVWKRNEMKDATMDGMARFQWIHLPSAKKNQNKIPNRTCMTLAHYDDALLLCGMNPEGKPSLTMSYDMGRTWKDTIVTTPLIDPATTAVGMAVDTDNYIWIICAGTGEVWRGRINRLGWRKEEFVW